MWKAFQRLCLKNLRCKHNVDVLWLMNDSREGLSKLNQFSFRNFTCYSNHAIYALNSFSAWEQEENFSFQWSFPSFSKLFQLDKRLLPQKYTREEFTKYFFRRTARGWNVKLLTSEDSPGISKSVLYLFVQNGEYFSTSGGTWNTSVNTSGGCSSTSCDSSSFFGRCMHSSLGRNSINIRWTHGAILCVTGDLEIERQERVIGVYVYLFMKIKIKHHQLVHWSFHN